MDSYYLTPRFHRLWTHGFARSLNRRSDHRIIAFTWGPVSIIWDRKVRRSVKSAY